jgi:galactokinase
MKLEDWLGGDAVVERLVSAGMSCDCAESAAGCFAQAARNLRPHAGGRSVVACWAPGRVEVLGKHTDYCGGDSILAAAERGFCMLAAARDDGVVTIVDPKNPVRAVVLDKFASPTIGHWSNYPHTVVRRLAKDFPQANRGATIAFASNLPTAAGMSSSSAFVVGTFLLLSQINNLSRDEAYASVIRSDEDLAGYLSTVENGLSFGPFSGDKGVGTFGGSEDHTAILCGRPGKLVQHSFCPVRFRRTIDVADEYVFAIASSGVVAEKTGAALEKYNRVSAMVRTIVDTWRNATNGEAQSLAEILHSSADAEDRLRTLLTNASDATFRSAELVERLEHFVTESQLILSVPDEICPATIRQFGELVRQSHSAAARLLNNQTPETNRLAEIADELGAHAASAFGAGFGGSVWALVENAAAPAFLGEWRARYASYHPIPSQQAEFFVTRPATPAIASLSG